MPQQLWMVRSSHCLPAAGWDGIPAEYCCSCLPSLQQALQPGKEQVLQHRRVGRREARVGLGWALESAGLVLAQDYQRVKHSSASIPWLLSIIVQSPFYSYPAWLAASTDKHAITACASSLNWHASTSWRKALLITWSRMALGHNTKHWQPNFTLYTTQNFTLYSKPYLLLWTFHSINIKLQNRNRWLQHCKSSDVHD